VDNDGEIYSDPSIEGLAKILDVDGLRLARTLDDYNRAIDAKDASSLKIPRTGKPKPLRAPFYGLRVVPGITFTMGGVLVNGQAQVMSENETPIGGLYAAGDAIGGLMGGYRGGYTGGLMQAVVTGLLAGENAARLCVT
jgi:fumarate reductase flavoprotein subunit